MKCFSVKLDMSETFDEECFYNIIVSWLKDSGPCANIGSLLERTENKSSTTINGDHCSIESFVFSEQDTTYSLCRFTHLYYSQLWTTDIILSKNDKNNIVYLHVDCSGDVTRFEKIPEIRNKVVLHFVNSGKLKEKELPITDKPLEWNDKCKKIVVSAINGEYAGEMPVIFLSRIFNSAGYIVDPEDIARRLAGMAYVIKEGWEEVTAELKEITNARNPYNGVIGVYFSSPGSGRKYSDPNGTKWNSITKDILTTVTNAVMAQVDRTAPTWNDLYNKKIAEESQKNREFIDEVFDINDTLENQLQTAKQKISKLTEENRNLRIQIENLKSVLDSSDIHNKLLTKAPTEEIFDGEQYDLVVTALNKALRSYNEDSRSKELLDAIIAANPLIGNGKVIEERLRNILNGENLTERDFDEMKELGFDVVSESNHYKLVFVKDKRYWFSVSKTPSDYRENKNLLSDILRALSIYK
ncbi:MAG: hypothetical protein LUI12_03330 [Clostridiales bacterium]|nr:hypothetical protein [Clostridiales bacterium]